MFNEPRTAFVAQFMGGHNVIATPQGPIAVRADRLKLRSARETGRLAGTVRAVEYQGTHLQVTLAAEQQGELTAMMNEAEFDAVGPRPGDTLVLDWSEADTHRLSAA